MKDYRVDQKRMATELDEINSTVEHLIYVTKG